MAAEDKGLTFTPLLHGTIDDAGVRAVVEVPRRALAATSARELRALLDLRAAARLSGATIDAYDDPVRWASTWTITGDTPEARAFTGALVALARDELARYLAATSVGVD